MSFSWQNVWLPLVALSGVASGTLLAGGFARSGAARRSGVSADAEVPDVLNAPPSGNVPLRLAAELLDAEGELVSVAGDFAGLAGTRSVRLETAIQPNLKIWADKAALREMLGGPMRAAVARSAGGRVLVGAGRRGGRIQISVLDDGPPLDRAMQETELREAARLIALHGGTLEVNVCANAGTTVVIRLPEPATAPAGAPAADGALQPAPQAVASMPAE